MGDNRRSSDVYWRCKYHLVWTPKNRFNILKGKLVKELYRLIYILCNMKRCELLELNYPDRSRASSCDNIQKVVSIHINGVLKGGVFNEFPHVRKKIWGNIFCARAYFVDTVGVNEEIIDAMFAIKISKIQSMRLNCRYR